MGTSPASSASPNAEAIAASSVRSADPPRSSSALKPTLYWEPVIEEAPKIAYGVPPRETRAGAQASSASRPTPAWGTPDAAKCSRVSSTPPCR